MLQSLPQTQDLSHINNPTKADYYVKHPAMISIHQWLKRHCPDALIYQLEVSDTGRRGVFGFYEFLGGMFVWPHDAVTGYVGIEMISSMQTPIADYIETLKTIGDKYPAFSDTRIPNIRRALLLPGTELLRYLTDKNMLMEQAIATPDTYFKPHPITTEHDLQLLTSMGKVLPREVSATYLLRHPDIEIGCTSCSTLAFQAKLNGKSVMCLDADPTKRRYRARYEKFAPYLYGDVNPARLASILSNPLSGYFHPGVAKERDVKAFFDFYMDIQRK